MFPILAIFSDYALLLLRLALGFIMVAHGWPKIKNLRGTGDWMASVGFRPGILWAVVAGIVEFLGGLALIAGLYVQVVAALMVVQFAVITVWKIAKREKFTGGMEFDILILAAALALLVLGGGNWIVGKL